MVQGGGKLPARKRMVLGLEMIEAANLDKRQRLSGPSMVMYLDKERLLSVMVFLEGFTTDHKRGTFPPAYYIGVSTR